MREIVRLVTSLLVVPSRHERVNQLANQPFYSILWWWKKKEKVSPVQVHSLSLSLSPQGPFLVSLQRFLQAWSAVVTSGGEGGNLGLAGSGQHPVISRVGQHLGNTAALSAHWNPSSSASSKYISTNSTTDTSLSGPTAWTPANRHVAEKINTYNSV